LLRREGEASGVNRIYRLYREEGLTVRKRRARRRAVGTRAPILVEAKPNARWSLDFVHDQFACGRRFRVLNIVDDVTRECWPRFPDTSISGRRVARELTELIAHRGTPGMIVSDHGTEFTSNAILAWSKDHAIEWHYIAPGKPMQNGYVESFNGRMRDELLNESLFFASTTPAARSRMAGGLQHREASFLARLSDPGNLCEVITATGSDAVLIEGSAPPPVALPAPKRRNRNGRALIANWMTVQWQVTFDQARMAFEVELGAVVGDDPCRRAAVGDQFRQFTGNPTAGDRGVRNRGQTFASHVVDDIEHTEAPAQANWSWTKSSDQRAFGFASTRIGARVPTARRLARRLRTVSPSSR